MAIVIAAGIPNSETTADTVNASPVSHTWPAAMPRRAMSRQAANSRRRQRQPFDLLPHQPVPGPVPDGE